MWTQVWEHVPAVNYRLRLQVTFDQRSRLTIDKRQTVSFVPPVNKSVQKTIFRRNSICVGKKLYYEQHAIGVLSTIQYIDER